MALFLSALNPVLLCKRNPLQEINALFLNKIYALKLPICLALGTIFLHIPKNFGIYTLQTRDPKPPALMNTWA